MEYALSEIIPHLFVGNLYSAQDAELLRKRGIRHVLSVLDEDDFLVPVPDVKYKRWSLYDEPDEDIVPVCKDVYEYLERSMDSVAPRNILVHCAEGRSRSVCVVAYFLRRYELAESVEEALDCIAKKRQPISIRPSVIFVDQIKKEFGELDEDSGIDSNDSQKSEGGSEHAEESEDSQEEYVGVSVEHAEESEDSQEENSQEENSQEENSQEENSQEEHAKVSAEHAEESEDSQEEHAEESEDSGSENFDKEESEKS
jgi:flagellar biosynthesis GTPase FlhF